MVTRYVKIDHSQANMILQYRVQYLTQHYFFNFFFFADYENMVFPLLISSFMPIHRCLAMVTVRRKKEVLSQF